MKVLRACYDWRVITALAAVGGGVVLFAPSLIGAALPLLIVAVCPLSMMIMMKTMGGHDQNATPAAAAQPMDRVEQLRTELAASRLEQQRLARELEGLETPAAAAVRPTQPTAARSADLAAIDLSRGSP